MTFQQGVVLTVLAVLVVLLGLGRHAPAMVFTGAAGVFFFLNFVTLEQVLKDFSNTGLLTVWTNRTCSTCSPTACCAAATAGPCSS